jgi:dihydroxy-acid dehydratase
MDPILRGTLLGGGTSGPTGDPTGMDTPLLIIGALLVATLIAFFTGILPYPIGWIILTVAFIGRLLVLKSR